MSEDIKAELDRVLSSSEFRNCKRVSQLLKHIIKTHLENKSESLTGIAIAQDLFGKDEYFDPAKDPVVRVNMARLRKMLKAYYKNEGAENPLKITIPLGAYKPNIIKNNIDTSRWIQQKGYDQMHIVYHKIFNSSSPQMSLNRHDSIPKSNNIQVPRWSS